MNLHTRYDQILFVYSDIIRLSTVVKGVMLKVHLVIQWQRSPKLADLQAPTVTYRLLTFRSAVFAKRHCHTTKYKSGRSECEYTPLEIYF